VTVVKLGYVIAASGATCTYVTGHLKQKKISHYFEYNRFVFPFFEDEQMERVEKKRGE